MSAKREGSGLTTLEFALTLALIAALSWFALERLLFVEEYSEMTVVDATVRNVRSGLRYAVSEAIIHGREASVGEWAGGNPVRWLEKPPDGYLGEYAGRPQRPTAGAWWFDSRGRQLCYLPKLTSHLALGEGASELCWRIEVAAAAAAGAAPRLLATRAYRWF